MMETYIVNGEKPFVPTRAPAGIHQAMVNIMLAVEPIAKDRKNEKQGYKFRGIDDVYAALQRIMAANGVYTTSVIDSHTAEEKTSKSGSVQVYRTLKIRYFFNHVDGSSIATEVIGEGMDSGDKASNKAMSVAHKYALLQAFCIPTEEPKDPENDSHELAPPQQAAPAPKPKQAPLPPPNVPMYTGTNEQKQRLAAALQKAGLDSRFFEAVNTALMNKPTSQWAEIAKLVKETADAEATGGL